MKIKEIENRLFGEQEKAVWSLMWEYKEMRTKDIAVKIGRSISQVSNVIKKLVDMGAVDFVEGTTRGLYRIKKGVVK